MTANSKTVPEEVTDLCSVFRRFALYDVRVMRLYKTLLGQLPGGFDAYVERVQEGTASFGWVDWAVCAASVATGVLLTTVIGAFWPLVLGCVAGSGWLINKVIRSQRI